MAKLEKKRKYERDLVSHFSGRMEKFDRLQGYAHLEDDGSEGQGEREENQQKEDGLFYSWECISLVRNNDTTIDLVIE